jgi:hypothetical protein
MSGDPVISSGGDTAHPPWAPHVALTAPKVDDSSMLGLHHLLLVRHPNDLPVPRATSHSRLAPSAWTALDFLEPKWLSLGSLLFQGPSIPIGARNGLCLYQNHYAQCHINNRCMDKKQSNTFLTKFICTKYNNIESRLCFISLLYLIYVHKNIIRFQKLINISFIYFPTQIHKFFRHRFH